MADLSRRAVLKGGLLGLTTVALGPGAVCRVFASDAGGVGRYVSLYTGRVLEGTATTCGLCEAGCGLLAFRDEGRLVGLAGNPEHPRNRGALCALGSAAFQGAEDPSRLTRPLRRKGARGEGRWEEISWEAALGLAAGVLGPLQAVRGAGGGPAVCVPGRGITPLARRFLSAFRGGILAVADDHEHVVEREAHRAFHADFHGVPDLENAARVLNFGADPLGSPRRLVGTARRWAAAKARGARWTTLDPRLSETAAASDAWVPLRPGTDAVVALSLAALILENRWEDRSFLARCGADPDRLRALFRDWRLDRAAAASGVPVERLRELARELALQGPSAALFGSGVTASAEALEGARAVLAMNFLVGSVGRRGGLLVPGRIRWREPRPAAPPGREGEPEVLHGTLFWELGSGTRKIGCLLTASGANPAVTDPACGETVKVLRDEGKVPFHVALADRLDETSSLADLVLPASNFLESWGLSEGLEAGRGGGWLSLRRPVVTPPAGCASLDEWLLRLARRLGGASRRAVAFRDAAEYYRLLVGATAPGGAAAYREMERKGFVQVPVRGEEFPGRYRVQEVLAGLVPRISEALRRKADLGELSGGGMTLLLVGSPTRGGDGSRGLWVEEIDHADPLWIHPRAAGRIGCRDGERVVVRGPAGEIRTRVRLTEGIHPGAVALARIDRDREAPPSAPSKGEARLLWWGGETYGENGRKVVPWPEDPRRRPPGWMATRVKIERIGNKAEG